MTIRNAILLLLFMTALDFGSAAEGSIRSHNTEGVGGEDAISWLVPGGIHEHRRLKKKKGKKSATTSSSEEEEECETTTITATTTETVRVTFTQIIRPP